LGKNSPPKRSFWARRLFEIEQNGVEDVEIDTRQCPAGVEVARFVLGCDEAAVQPHLPAARHREERERVGQAVEQLAAAFVPAEPLDDLIPCRDMLARREPARVGIEGCEHATTLSLL